MQLFPIDWPDQLSVSPDSSLIEYAVYLVRCQNYLDAEKVLLSYLPTGSEYLQATLILLARISLARNRFAEFSQLKNRLSFDLNYVDEIKYLELLYLYKSKQTNLLKPFEDSWWQPSNFSSHYFALLRIKIMIVLGDHVNAWSLYENLSDRTRQSIEGLIVQAFYLIRIKDFHEAFELVRTGSKRFPAHEELQSLTCELAILSRSQQHTISVYQDAFTHFPRNPIILKGIITVQFLQNLNADTRRTCLLDRLYAFTSSSLLLNHANLFAAYERNGNCDWVNFAKYDVSDNQSSSTSLKENLALQLSSCESPLVEDHLSDLYVSRKKELLDLGVQFLQSANFAESNQIKSKLRIAWCSSDIANHPVFRFIYSFFCQSTSLSCDHYIVDTNYHAAESTSHLLDSLSNVKYINLGSIDRLSRITAARDLAADISIDLSGWTGGHFQDGFMARIAKYQFNYLGYFASTGIPQTDYWIGDKYLFPKQITEFHCERILRLNRCFIAWQPADELIESTINVVEMSQPSDQIRFGSFNANRKLSDVTLSTWGRILQSVPGSRLVLKASNADDPRTMQILRNRMIQNRLDPERILWISRTKGSGEHLKQYSHMDIALDPFPNGGCTTTCEALWMGVPTITLTGSSYVSRMSTAVLNGAGLSSWCASNIQEYIQLAILNAQNVAYMRHNREYWRRQIVMNQLGDAQSLMTALEQLFMSITQTN